MYIYPHFYERKLPIVKTIFLQAVSSSPSPCTSRKGIVSLWVPRLFHIWNRSGREFCEKPLVLPLLRRLLLPRRSADTSIPPLTVFNTNFTMAYPTTPSTHPMMNPAPSCTVTGSSARADMEPDPELELLLVLVVLLLPPLLFPLLPLPSLPGSALTALPSLESL